MRLIVFVFIAIFGGGVIWYIHDGRMGDAKVAPIAVETAGAAPISQGGNLADVNVASIAPVSSKVSSRIDVATSALQSDSPMFVREQVALVRNCTAIARRQEDLMLMKSGVFPETRMPKSDAERAQIVNAVTRVLADCEDFLRLGQVRLRELNKNLRTHGENLNSPLFRDPLDKDQERQLAALLLSSKSSELIEAGANEMVRGLIDDAEDAKGHKDAELWDRALFIAGCRLGSYCGKDSIQAATLCWKSRICDTGVEAFWLSELDQTAVALVNARTDALVKWLRSAAAQEVSAVKNYSQLAKAVVK